MEDRRDEVSRLLLTLEKTNLVSACEHLKCKVPEGGFAPQARRALIRLAEATLDETEEGEESERYEQYLERVLSHLASLQPAQEGVRAEAEVQETSELEDLKTQYQELRRRMKDDLSALEEKIKQREQPAGGDSAPPPKEENKAAPLTTIRLPEVTLRREFRIVGQIGDPGQKDKLSYTSLLNQIEAGRRKGHDEVEIIEAVIRAVSPGLHLREMLEIKRELTLHTLKTILKGHYKVDSSSDLLHRLMTMTQDPKESAQNFLFRAIELKEKLMRKSSDNDAGEEGEQYSSELIQRKFLRSIETGLYSDSVKFQLKPYLSNLNVTDEVLIERITEAANLEQERQQKLRKTVINKPPRFNEVQAEAYSPDTLVAENDTIPTHETGRKSKKNQEPRQTQTNTIEALKAEVLEMKKLMLQTVEATKPRVTEKIPMSGRSRPKGCRACQEAHMGESCRHCFRCGQEGHLSRGCRRSREQQGNETGLPGRDSR